GEPRRRRARGVDRSLAPAALAQPDVRAADVAGSVRRLACLGIRTPWSALLRLRRPDPRENDAAAHVLLPSLPEVIETALMASAEDLLSWGVFLRFAAIGTYAAAFVSYAGRLAVQKLKLDRAATSLAVLGVATHTAYLVTRWIAAGQIEILSREKSGDVLSSMDRL